MGSAFRGRFESKLDQKGRLSLPAAYRSAIEAATPLVITNSQYQGLHCLDAYPLPAWEALEARVARLPQLKAEVQAFKRFYLASGQVVEIDGNNRLLVPQSLRQFASLEGSVQLVGMTEKFEIWSNVEWQKLYQGLASSFTDTLAVIADLDAAEESSASGSGGKSQP